MAARGVGWGEHVLCGSLMNRYAFEIRDRLGRTVRYTHSNYEWHVQRHPEIEGLLETIGIAVSDPDIEFAADNGHTYYYRRGLGGGRFANLWLFVVVWYEATGSGEVTGIIKTSYFTSRISRDGRVVWQRRGL